MHKRSDHNPHYYYTRTDCRHEHTNTQNTRTARAIEKLHRSYGGDAGRTTSAGSITAKPWKS